TTSWTATAISWWRRGSWPGRQAKNEPLQHPFCRRDAPRVLSLRSQAGGGGDVLDDRAVRSLFPREPLVLHPGSDQGAALRPRLQPGVDSPLLQVVWRAISATGEHHHHP